MDRREFIAAAGTVAAGASASQAFAQMAEELLMHPPKYKALEEATAHCVATGNDCLRHVFDEGREHGGLCQFGLSTRRRLCRAADTGGGEFRAYRAFCQGGRDDLQGLPERVREVATRCRMQNLRRIM